MFAVQLLFVFTLVQPGFGQSAEEFKALKDDVKALKAGQVAIQKDLQEIKKLLQARPQPQAQPQPEFKEAVINVKDRPFKGDKDAKLAFVEFSDYQ